MQFRVTIPSHVKAGQVIRIRCPDGTEGDVTVPKGLRSGDSFVFEMGETILTTSRDNRNVDATTTAASSTEIASVTPSSTVEIRGFLDREIVNLQDFAMALGVGLLIGLSIVAGFLMGVLHVTDNSAAAHNAIHQQQQHFMLQQQQHQNQQQPQMRMPNSGSDFQQNQYCTNNPHGG